MASDNRAERAILDRAEAYRLVEEAREQRERADRAELACREMREALVLKERFTRAHPSEADFATCRLCDEVAQGGPEDIQHKPDCLLATPPSERAALILEAAEDLYVELNDAAFGWDMVPLKVQRDAREALDRWHALVGERARPAVGGQ